MFYRRLEFGATVREPSHYLNASRPPMPGLSSFSGVSIAGARTRLEAQAPVRSAILGGPGRPVAARRGLGGTVGRPGWRSCYLGGSRGSERLLCYLGGSRGCCATSSGPGVVVLGWWVASFGSGAGSCGLGGLGALPG